MSATPAWTACPASCWKRSTTTLPLPHSSIRTTTIRCSRPGRRRPCLVEMVAAAGLDPMPARLDILSPLRPLRARRWDTARPAPAVSERMAFLSHRRLGQRPFHLEGCGPTCIRSLPMTVSRRSEWMSSRMCRPQAHSRVWAQSRVLMPISCTGGSFRPAYSGSMLRPARKRLAGGKEGKKRLSFVSQRSGCYRVEVSPP